MASLRPRLVGAPPWFYICLLFASFCLRPWIFGDFEVLPCIKEDSIIVLPCIKEENAISFGIEMEKNFILLCDSLYCRSFVIDPIHMIIEIL